MKEEEDLKKRLLILSHIEDLASDFLYYDRKEDEELPRGEIQKAVKDGIITIEEMSNAFKQHLIDTCK